MRNCKRAKLGLATLSCFDRLSAARVLESLNQSVKSVWHVTAESSFRAPDGLGLIGELDQKLSLRCSTSHTKESRHMVVRLTIYNVRRWWCRACTSWFR